VDSPDNAAAIDFLRWAQPSGPWVLTAIVPEGNSKTETASFTAVQEKELLQWLETRNGKFNLYWMTNKPRALLTSKASKEDVESIQFLHVDLDPDKGKDIVEERERILKSIVDFIPKPSGIVDSGGGYQAFWRLDEDFYVGGDLIRAADGEAYSIQLGLILGGDATHNCDRIMRLPGTLNIPNERKKKAGRAPALAVAVELTDRVYGLSSFLPAPRAPARAEGDALRGGQSTVSLGNLQPVSMEDLPEHIPARIKALIVQGADPEDPTKYGSRSHVVWAVTCALLRAGCKPETIASVILDPDYGVSEHVRRQPRPVAYAERQIQRAREEVEEPMLRVLNEKHAVIGDMGGRCRIISEVVDLGLGSPRMRLAKQSFDDFRNRYMNRFVTVGKTEDGKPKLKAAGAWWLGHPMRRQYDSLVFAPGREVEGAYNLWQGFACEALPGDKHEPFLAHVRDNICNGNHEIYTYVLGWMARAVQNPAQPGEVALVTRGGQGTGKGVFGRHFGSLWGRHFLQISNAKHLVGQFNSHLRDCVFLFADEAFFAGDRQHESILKTLITEDTFMAEAKGVDAEVAPNYVHLYMASNKSWVVPAGADERRVMIVDVGEDKKQDGSYFAAIQAAMDGGGRESLLHYLMTYDLSGFSVRATPKTEALRDQKLLSLAPEEQWWLERLTDGRTTSGVSEWRRTVPKEAVNGDYIRFCDNQKINRRLAPVALGRFLTKMMPAGWPRSVQLTENVDRPDGQGGYSTTKERVYNYQMPSLEDCRASWEGKFGTDWSWPVDEMAEQRGGQPY
jgi:hypothetical protein